MKPLHILLLLCLCLGGYGQKYDHQWLIGYTGSVIGSDSLWSVSNIDFRSGSPVTSWEYRSISVLDGGSSICDKAGELQFYYNGMQIRNRNNQLLSNGTGLSPGAVAANASVSGGSYPSPRGSVVLPKPNSDSVYYILHGGIEYGSVDGAYYKYLYYTVVDMHLQNGLGEVVDKNHIILQGRYLLQDTVWVQENLLIAGGISTCKHANGRDWWIIIRKARTTDFYKYLLTPNGIDTIGVQNIGDTINTPPGRISNVFTPDGSMFIYSNDKTQLHFLDFDRCDGMFSNHRRFDVEDSLTQITGGVCFDGVAVSPNSRYLYVSTNSELKQFDLKANNVEQSKIVIANVCLGNNPTTLSFSQLAPDGKIYVVPIGADTFLHVINYPDSIGLSSGFEKRALETQSWNHTYLPTYPNYRLGPVVGSICDSLPHNTGITERKVTIPLHLYPNPATTEITITADETMLGSHLTITDITGRQVLAVPLSTANSTFSIQHFAAGIYHVLLKRGAQTIAVGKFVKE